MSDPVTDLKRELLAAAERQHHPAPGLVKERRFLGYARVPRLLPIGAAVAVAAGAALFLTPPSSNSPGFLARAEAALTQPKGMILHEKWVETSTYIHPTCTIRRTAELWISGADARFRAFMQDPYAGPRPFMPADAKRACSPGSVFEIGGLVGGSPLRFVPPNRLVRMPGKWVQTDPVGDLRRAIRAGRAHDEGKTTRAGRTVERIRLDGCCRGTQGYAYVDPETFYPVETDLPTLFSESGRVRITGRIVTRFAAFQYLPRTAANLALTNIRAQHPHARLTVH